MYNVSTEFLHELGFKEYFSELAEVVGINKAIQPPENSIDIFMGCGHIENKMLEMGIIVKTNELFDQQSYPHGIEARAKDIKNFYTYYDNGICEPIGFSGNPFIWLNDADVCDTSDPTRLTAHTMPGCYLIWK